MVNFVRCWFWCVFCVDCAGALDCGVSTNTTLCVTVGLFLCYNLLFIFSNDNYLSNQKKKQKKNVNVVGMFDKTWFVSLHSGLCFCFFVKIW